MASILNRARQADSELVTANPDISDSVQRHRNKLYESAAAELTDLLAKLCSEHMGMPPDPALNRRNRHAAETLLDWYEWEMDELSHALNPRSSVIPAHWRRPTLPRRGGEG